MEYLEDCAALSEVDAADPMQQALAADYRRVVGIPTEARHEFRAVLERIKDGGEGVVQQVMEDLRRRYQSNGFSPAPGI